MVASRYTPAPSTSSQEAEQPENVGPFHPFLPQGAPSLPTALSGDASSGLAASLEQILQHFGVGREGGGIDVCPHVAVSLPIMECCTEEGKGCKWLPAAK